MLDPSKMVPMEEVALQEEEPQEKGFFDDSLVVLVGRLADSFLDTVALGLPLGKWVVES